MEAGPRAETAAGADMDDVEDDEEVEDMPEERNEKVFVHSSCQAKKFST